MRVRRVRRSLMALYPLAFLLLAGCHGAPPANPEFIAMTDWKADFYLAADSEAGPGYLVRDEAKKTDSHMRAADLASAASTTAQSLQNPLGGPSWAFTMKAPVPEDLFLNLSAPVAGTLYISNDASARVAERGYHSNRIRIEAWQGATLLGGAEYVIDGGNSVAGYYLATVQPAWLPVRFLFWPEAAKIREGEALTVKVTMRAAHTDLLIGTGGTHASYIRFFYFPDDPIAGRLYLHGGRFVSEGNLSTQRTDPPSGGKATEGPAALAATGIPALLGLALAARPLRRTGLLVVLLLLMTGLGGCIGGGGSPSGGEPHGSTSATVSATIVPKEGPRKEGKGDIEGVVHTEDGFAVKAAHVSLLGTSRFTRSDAQGRFRMGDVIAGGYVLRVDADNYHSRQMEILVVEGNTTRLDIPLLPLVDKGANFRPHQHPEWGDATSHVLHDAPMTVPLCSSSDALGGGGVCLYDVLVPTGKRVFPGTGRVDIQLSWNNNQTGVARELALVVSTGVPLVLPPDAPDPTYDNSYVYTERRYLARGSGAAFHVNVFPNEADPGHQKFTNWRFQLLTPEDDLYLQSGQALGRAEFTVNVRIIIHRTVIPYEPPHPDRWEGRDQFPLWKNLDPYPFDNTYIQNQQSCKDCYLWEIVPPQGAFVPPGTLEIRGYVKVTRTTSLSQATLTLYYKGADQPPYPSGNWPTFSKPAVMGGTPDNLTFTIKIGDGEADQFYQSFSYWRFFLGISSGTEITQVVRFRVGATVVKDPAYDPAS